MDCIEASSQETGEWYQRIVQEYGKVKAQNVILQRAIQEVLMSTHTSLLLVMPIGATEKEGA